MFGYAHKNTDGGERNTPTAAFNKPHIPESIAKIRSGAFGREIPVSDDETLSFLITAVRAVKPKSILELGTAVGVSGAVMLVNAPKARLTTVERDKNFYEEAFCGDAGELIQKSDGCFDLIFLDCAKVQYVKYLPRLKELLNRGGVLIADDVLLFGYVTGEIPVPPKRRMLVEHIKEYLAAVTGDSELSTTVLNIGNGVAMSVKL